MKGEEVVKVFECKACANVVHSRDERRWIEKQNRAARAQRKKEEMLRVRSLVGEPGSNHPVQQLNPEFARCHCFLRLWHFVVLLLVC